MKRNKILIFVENIFTQRDFDRFGIKLLQERGFEITVWDFTPYLHPKVFKKTPTITHSGFDGLKIMDSRKTVRKSLAGLQGLEIVLSFVSYSPKAVWGIYNSPLLRDTHLGVTILGIIPQRVRMSDEETRCDEIRSKPFSLAQRMIRSPDSLVRRPKQFIYDQLKKIVRKTLFSRVKLPDYVLMSGTKAIQYKGYPLKLSTNKIWCHALDYDLYLESETDCPIEEKMAPYAVFLDEFGSFHPDFELFGIAPYYSPEAYFPALVNFFEHVEEKTECKVVIAAHPKSDYDRYPDFFGGRKVIRGDTINLVKNSLFVIAHASTSLNFAVLYSKPAIFLTEDTYHFSFRRQVKASAMSLGKRPINLSGKFPNDLANELTTNQEIYDRYKENYIKRPGTPEKNSWEIFADYCDTVH